MVTTIQFRPWHEWPRPPTRHYQRRASPFTATYRSTLELLDRELRHLQAKQVIVQLALQPRDIRQDGMPRSDARAPEHPGVVISFESRHGPLQFVCDEFTDWKSNIRGIALTLERLRLADLYGVTKHGEQYRGWTALPPHAGEQAPVAGAMSEDQAAAFIARECSNAAMTARDILESNAAFRSAYREIAARLHPDAGGDNEAFLRLQQAAEVLRRRHNG